MRVVRHLTHVTERLPRVVLTLGNFDGAHRGHQAILGRARAEADRRSGQVVVLTFHPHPVAVLAPSRAPAMLQSLHDRLATLRACGADTVVLQRFTRTFAQLTPEAFVRDWLLRHLDVRHVVVGHDVNFGKDRAGSADTLHALGDAAGFSVELVGAVRTAGEVVVSSSGVRKAVTAGDIPLVTALMGRPHALRGRVVQGDRRGRTLGFPTANLHLGRPVLLPPDGVYAVWALVDGQRVPAVMNIGVRPTIGTPRRTVEVHCLDFDADLYGRWLRVELVARLRGEQKFADLEALAAAIAADTAHTRTILGVA